MHWDAVEGAADYVVSRAGSTPVIVTDLNHVAMGLRASTEYSFSVSARNAAGTSAPAVITAATLYAPAPRPSVPHAPVGLTVDSSTTTSFTVRWDDPMVAGAVLPTTAYWVQAGEDTPVRVTDRVFTATGLTPGIEQTVAVWAENTMGQGPRSSVVARTRLSPAPNPVPATPRSLRATAPTATSITVDWLAPSTTGAAPVVAYLVTWAGSQRTTTATSLLLTDLRPATIYDISVVAMNNSGWSTPVTITTRTSDAPDPGPAPGPGPAPSTPSSDGPPIAPVISGTNADGSFSADLDARSLQQVLPGRWPTASTVVAARDLFMERSARMVTNAGQRAQGTVTYRSPSIQSARIVFDHKKQAYVLRATLKPNRVSGAVIVTVRAPAHTAHGVVYEPLSASKRFTVVRPSAKRR